MKVIAIIQARMGSTRLPAKVLKDLIGEPLLAHVIARTSRAQTLAQVVVATTQQPADDAIVDLCQQRGWSYSRGSELDVLDRYYQAAKTYEADIVVRITSDCPLIEPTVIDKIVGVFLQRQPKLDYVSNTLSERTYPRGLDVEVIRFEALARAWTDDDNPAWREHVTPYIYRHPELFQMHTVTHATDYSHLRWTVDTPQDLDLIQRIYEAFGHNRFSWHEVLDLLAQHPDWSTINQDVQQKAVD